MYWPRSPGYVVLPYFKAKMSSATEPEETDFEYAPFAFVFRGRSLWEIDIDPKLPGLIVFSQGILERGYRTYLANETSELICRG